jgi:hypothetical protein
MFDMESEVLKLNEGVEDFLNSQDEDDDGDGFDDCYDPYSGDPNAGDSLIFGDNDEYDDTEGEEESECCNESSNEVTAFIDDVQNEMKHLGKDVNDMIEIRKINHIIGKAERQMRREENPSDKKRLQALISSLKARVAKNPASKAQQQINEDVVKSEVFRECRRINKALQRSDMNPLLKPYFTESSLQFVSGEDGDGFDMILLNSEAINNEAMLAELPDRYANNLKYLSETVNDILKRDGYEGRLELVDYTESNELMEFGNTLKNKYLNCGIRIYSEEGEFELNKATTMRNDIPWEERNNRKQNLDISASDYYKMFDDPAGATTRELRAEVTSEADDDKFIPNTFNRLDNNYILNKSVSASDDLYESVDFMNNLSDDGKRAAYTLLREQGFIKGS